MNNDVAIDTSPGRPSSGSRPDSFLKKISRLAFSFRPEELLAAVFFFPSALVTLKANMFFVHSGQAVPPRIIHGWIRLAVTAIAMGLFAIFVHKKPFWKQLGWIREITPFLFCIAVYTNMHDTVHFVNPHDVHDALIKIDQVMFGVQPCVWVQKYYHPILTDIFSISYMNYFVITVSVVVWLLLEKRSIEMREALFGTILCFYMGYLLYVIFPAAPPRLTLANQFVRDFSGSWITTAQMKMIDINPTSSRGAFPSLHCAITFISWLYAYKFRKLLFWLILGPGAILVLSTVYLRHHYVIDIIAGFALAILAYRVSPMIDRWWARHSPQRTVQQNLG